MSSLSKFLFKRALMIPLTLLGVTFITFLILNLAPGGPVEQRLEKIRQGSSQGGGTRAARGVPKEVVEAIKKQYGFDQPFHERFVRWTTNAMRFEFGKSFEHQRPVMDVIGERTTVSLLLGVLSFLITYVVAIGIAMFMSVRAGSLAEKSVLWPLLAVSAIPSFVIAALLVTLFANPSFLNLFPAGYAQSENYAVLDWSGKIIDRIRHLTLPLLAHVAGSLSALALVSRDTLEAELKRDHIRTARAIGVDETTILHKHAFRNAMMPIVTGFGTQLAAFLTGSLFIETVFQLNGLGSLGYEAILARDYNVIMGLVFLQSLALLVGNLISDVAYALIDPRVDFEAQA